MVSGRVDGYNDAGYQWFKAWAQNILHMAQLKPNYYLEKPYITITDFYLKSL